MSFNVDNLVIEVTRKCNMKCPHCLRGNAQRKIIPNEYIDKMLRLIDNVSTLSITGGEPTLAMDTLNYIKKNIGYGQCDVGNFYMVTNGKAINVKQLAEWADIMVSVCSDNEISAIAFSFDNYHRDTFSCYQYDKQKRNYDALIDLLNYEYGFEDILDRDNFVYKHSDDSWDNKSLIREGRAKDFGTKDKKAKEFEIDYYDNNTQVSENQLYLSCSGYIVAGCDWSYDSIDNNLDIRIAHIDDLHCPQDLLNAIKEYNKKCEKQLQFA